MLLIKNARLHTDMTNVVDILACGRVIIAIGPKIECGLPIDHTVDAGGLTAIPGYIDQHVHVTGGGGEGGFSNQVPPLRLSALVDAGVTTVVGLLGTDGTTRSVENLVAKTKAFNEEGWTAYCLTGSYELPSPTITGSVTRDIAFIQEVIGVKVAISDHRSSGPTKDELVRLAFSARMGGLLSGKPGVMHMHLGSGRDELRTIIEIVRTTDIPISIFKPTHLGSHIEMAAEFAALGGYADFTAGTDAEATAQTIIKARAAIPHDRITLSSDGNGSFPKWNDKKEMIGISAGKITNDHEVVRALVKHEGLTLDDAIELLTVNPATSLGLYPYKGSLAVGSCADILLIDDALDIDTVIANGRVFKEHGRRIYTPKFED